MRSKLFVPCSRPELFAKAFAGDADALSFDLEDSVPADGKVAARANLIEMLRSDKALGSGKRIVVRVNALDTPLFADDMAALAGSRIDLLNLPKIETADAARTAAARAADAGVAAPLLVTVETPLGVASVAAIAVAHSAIVGTQVGLNDLFAPLGIDRRDPRNVHAALWSIRLGAAGSPMFVYDGAWPDLTDDDGFRAEAEMARGLGYLGKSCIHPRQVPIANAVFDRGDASAAARRLLAAAARAKADGRGAFAFEGRMVDAPMIAAARAMIDGAERSR